MSHRFQVVFFRDGNSLRGNIQTDPISIETSFGKLKFKIKNIAQIQIKNPPYANLDIIRLLNGDKSTGNIPGEKIPFLPMDAVEQIEINKDLIHTIMFMGHID